ncbi:hypothetical protein ACHWQZ_G016792 [Mnemiopsis leidyi]
MDMELELLREAALISMEEKQQQQKADELAALREAALDSARERKLSSDPLGKRRFGSMEGLGKRRLESPPSHHFGMRRGSGGYESYSDSENSGNLTPKMTADDSIKHTPPRCDPVFTVKMTDNMLLKRNNSHRTSSSPSNVSDKSPSPQTENKITVQLRNPKTSESESEKVTSDKSSPSALLPGKEVDNNHKSPARTNTLPVKVPVVADVSPALSKVSSVEDVSEVPPSKKQKKKHKKKKSGSKTKKPKQKVELESSSEDEKPAKKSYSDNHKSDKKENGGSARREKLKAAEARLEKLQSEFKQQVISENIISKIDKNIELLQNAKKSKQDSKKSHHPKRVISDEISSNEEEELLKSDKRKSNSSPRKRDRKKLKNSSSRRRSKSPSSPVDVSVSLKSKREFEQMKAELNKKATKSDKKESSKPSPRKESRSKSSKEVASSPAKQESKTHTKNENNVASLPVQNPVKQGNGTKPVDMDISEREEQELLGDLKPSSKNTTPLQPPPVPKTKVPDDFVSVMKEDSFSDSDQESDKVNVTSDKKPSADNKRRKSKKSKKKKGRDDKSKRKKKRKKHASDSSDSDDSDNQEKKKKVKIDKSELNKIVQFLKQRDEAQKSQDPKTTFNPKIISKEAKPIEIKLKSKPKR